MTPEQQKRGLYILLSAVIAISFAAVLVIYLQFGSPRQIVGSIRALYQISRAVRCRNAEQYDQSVAILNDAIQADPQSADAYYNRGFAYVDLGKYPEAVRDCTEALRINPQLASAHWIRGYAYTQTHDLDRCIADETEAIRIDPGFWLAYRDRGLAREGKEEYDEAIEDFTASITLKPMGYAYYYRSAAYRKKGEFLKAIADGNAAIERVPGEGVFYTNRGYAYACVHEPEAAIRDYERAVELDGNNPHGYQLLGWILATTPRDDLRNGRQAVEYARKACELSQWKDRAAVATLAAACAEAGDFDEAVRWQKKALEMPGWKGKAGEERLALFEGHKAFHANE